METMADKNAGENQVGWYIGSRHVRRQIGTPSDTADRIWRWRHRATDTAAAEMCKRGETMGTKINICRMMRTTGYKDRSRYAVRQGKRP